MTKLFRAAPPRRRIAERLPRRHPRARPLFPPGRRRRALFRALQAAVSRLDPRPELNLVFDEQPKGDRFLDRLRSHRGGVRRGYPRLRVQPRARHGCMAPRRVDLGLRDAPRPLYRLALRLQLQGRGEGSSAGTRAR